MKTILLSSALLFLAMGCAAPETPTTDYLFKADTSDMEIRIPIDQDFSIEFSETAGTGFFWSPEFDPDLLDLNGKTYHANSSGGDGGAELVRFSFTLKTSKATEVTFGLGRADETAIETRVVTVRPSKSE
ncbi:MAG: protease inhibitor I42 family protein [Pseudomonadota bacterium]